jgi:hypothetical protein
MVTQLTAKQRAPNMEASSLYDADQLDSIPHHQYIGSHLLDTTDGAFRFMAQHGYRVVLGVRDPRDQLVSDYFSSCQRATADRGSENLEMIRRFSKDEAITMLITGYVSPDMCRSSLVGRYRRWLVRWTDKCREFSIPIYLVRYESLESNPEKHIHELRNFLSVDVCARQLQRIIEANAGPDERNRGPRAIGGAGQVGRWRAEFTAAHAAIFKALWGQFLLDLGYERSFDWHPAAAAAAHINLAAG